MNRLLRLVLPAAIVLGVSGDAGASIFDGLLGGPVYKSFFGKFIDSKTVKAAVETPPPAAGQGSANMMGFSGNGKLIGESIWDSIPAPQLKAYGNGIVQRLLVGWNGPHPAIRLWVTSNPGLEANSTGSGDIYLARGWFSKCQNEDQIAAIIAHEMSHILLGHFQREEANEGRRRAVAGAATAAVTAFTLSDTRITASGNQVNVGVADQKKLNENLQKTLLIKFAINEVSSFAFDAAWAREQEEEADLLGADLLYRAKYNVPQMTEALKLLKEYEAQSEQQVDLLSDQYKTAMKDAAMTGNLDTMKQTGFTILLNEALSGADRLRDRLHRNHPDYDDRIQAMQGYIAREYDDDIGGKPHTAELAAFRANKGTMAILDNHNSSFDAEGAMVKSDFAKARSLAVRGASGLTADYPYPLRVMASAEQKSGNGGGGLKAMERAAESPDAAFNTLTALSGMYADARNYARAHAALKTAAERFGSEEATYPNQITLALKEGKTDEAERILKICSAAKNEDLVAACHEAHGETCSGLQILCDLGHSGNDMDNPLSHLFNRNFE
jgi:Zn-dependent protease with chaperone function